jgi:hypothetical protein
MPEKAKLSSSKLTQMAAGHLLASAKGNKQLQKAAGYFLAATNANNKKK